MSGGTRGWIRAGYTIELCDSDNYGDTIDDEIDEKTKRIGFIRKLKLWIKKYKFLNLVNKKSEAAPLFFNTSQGRSSI